MIKKIGNVETKITNTTGLIKLAFKIPVGLINTDATINRIYTIVRNHEGKVEFLKAEYDKVTLDNLILKSLIKGLASACQLPLVCKVLKFL